MMDDTYRVIVTGGKDYADYTLLEAECDKFVADIIGDRKVIIVSGGNIGAEKLAIRYAKERRMDLSVVQAEGRRPKPAVRNANLLKDADALIVFWDGEDADVAVLMQHVKERHLTVRVISYKAARESIIHIPMYGRCSLVRAENHQWAATWKDYLVAHVEQRGKDFIIKEMTSSGRPFRALMKASLDSAFFEICRFVRSEFKIEKNT